jgi:hypothetical protein
MIIGFVGWQFISRSFFNTSATSQLSATQRTEKAFANVPTAQLDATQRRILAILKEEYTKSPTSYDETVHNYTEGFDESWCADFITWVLTKADSTIINPDTGYWRIPGVVTLQQYYKDNEAYVLADSGYTPRLGDVVFYIGSQTPDESSGEHAAFVLGVTKDNKLITIGGNEGNGVLRIRTESVKTNISKGMVGYGKLYL